MQQIRCSNCPSRKDSMFTELGDHDLSCLDAHKTTNLYKKGQVIFHEGNRPIGVYCIKQGKVKIYKTGVDGREQIVRLAKTGDLVGYRSFLGEEFYSASASALEDCKICTIDKNDFNIVLNNKNDLSSKMIHQLSYELREAEDLIRDMAQKSVRERLAEVLLLLEKKFGTDNDEPGVLNAKLSREELASFVGTATETLIRLLSDLKAETVIESKAKKIKIIDREKLIKIANLAY